MVSTMVFAKPHKISRKQIVSQMEKIADWQLKNIDNSIESRKNKRDYAYWNWVYGSLYVGLIELSEISRDRSYVDFLVGMSEKNNYELGSDTYHADEISVGWLYLSLFEKYKKEEFKKPTLERLDYILANKPTGDLNFRRKGNQQRWSWCDAIFMAPPVFAKASAVTKDNRYLDYMINEIKVTYDTLYSKEEKLFYRDTSFKPKREANGKKIFWSRGNGWVVAGLCRIIDQMPENHESRTFYVNLYKEMMEKIVSLQNDKGYWTASMLDPDSYPSPEMSATGFFTYALAWGINNRILPAEKYKVNVLKAWSSLCASVHKDGKLGWVQPIGAAPQSVTFDMTEIYGVGAFLLAGSQLYNLK